MIFLSAQPDEFFFTWQIEVQILNFHSLGINKEDYHILIGINQKKGLSSDFQKLIDKYSSLASFYIYNDTRRNKTYVPSIRPHIIKKHFAKFSHLTKETIFYHDSDIILRKLPFTEGMLSDNISYVSNTRNYLDSNYVTTFIGEKGLSVLCSIAGITTKQAKDNDENCGGAQYILKNIDQRFWNKIEKRCERMYKELSNINALKNFERSIITGRQTKCPGIQAWCADMWAVFYTIIEERRPIKISDELNFCWADSPIEQWEQCSILHYTGNQEQDVPIFRKTQFKHYSPVYDVELKKVSKATCGYKVVEYIHQLERSVRKYELEDTLFVFQIPQDSDSFNIVTIVYEYIASHFAVDFIIFISDTMKDVQQLHECGDSTVIEYIQNKRKRLAEYKEKGVKYIVEYPYDTIVQPKLIYDLIFSHWQKKYDVSILQLSGNIVDKLLTQMFYKLKDIELFYVNIGKLIPLCDNSSHSLKCFSIDYYLEQYLPDQHVIYSENCQKHLTDKSFFLT